MKELSAIQKPFKYVGECRALCAHVPRLARRPAAQTGARHPAASARAVTTTLTQKTGASVQTATSQYWDTANDNYVTYKYETNQMQCLTTVYGICI